jgi:hypothetical protein
MQFEEDSASKGFSRQHQRNGHFKQKSLKQKEAKHTDGSGLPVVHP